MAGLRLRSDFLYVLVFAMTTSAASRQQIFAQEALRSALQSDASARLRESPPVNPAKEARRIGPVTFDIRLGYSLDARDNITYTKDDRQSDLIQRPWLDIDMSYQASEQSRLSVNARFGYEDYIDNSQHDRFSVAPGSEVALDIRIGSSTVTVFDRMDFSQDVASEGALSGVARFPRFENTVGLRSVWQFDKWIWQAGYSHLNVLATEDDSSSTQSNFDYLERADEQFFGRAGRAFDFPVQAGVEVSGSLSDYALPIQQDRYTIAAGPFLNWKAADALEIALRGGLAYTVFESTNSAMDDTDLASYYVGLQLNHRLTQHTTYRFSATHDIRAGINIGSDYIETTRLGVEASWEIMQYLTLEAQLFGEHSEEAAVDSPASSASETYRRIGAGINASCDLTRRLSLFARYAFVAKDSDDKLRNYSENRVTIGVNYRY